MTSFVTRCRSTRICVKVCCEFYWCIWSGGTDRNWVKVWDDTAKKVLSKRGVEIRFNTRVKSLTEEQVFLIDGL